MRPIVAAAHIGTYDDDDTEQCEHCGAVDWCDCDETHCATCGEELTQREIDYGTVDCAQCRYLIHAQAEYEEER